MQEDSWLTNLPQFNRHIQQLEMKILGNFGDTIAKSKKLCPPLFIYLNIAKWQQ